MTGILSQTAPGGVTLSHRFHPEMDTQFWGLAKSSRIELSGLSTRSKPPCMPGSYQRHMGHYSWASSIGSVSALRASPQHFLQSPRVDSKPLRVWRKERHQAGDSKATSSLFPVQKPLPYCRS